MSTDPDAEGGPDPAWYRAELDACRKRIAELEAICRIAGIDDHYGYDDEQPSG